MGNEDCEVCCTRVFLMERLAIEGHVLHRACFKCSKCAVQLKPGAYDYDPATDMFYCRKDFRDLLRQQAVTQTIKDKGITSFEEGQTNPPRRGSTKTPGGLASGTKQADLQPLSVVVLGGGAVGPATSGVVTGGAGQGASRESPKVTPVHQHSPKVTPVHQHSPKVTPVHQDGKDTEEQLRQGLPSLLKNLAAAKKGGDSPDASATPALTTPLDRATLEQLSANMPPVQPQASPRLIKQAPTVGTNASVGQHEITVTVMAPHETPRDEVPHGPPQPNKPRGLETVQENGDTSSDTSTRPVRPIRPTRQVRETPAVNPPVMSGDNVSKQMGGATTNSTPQPKPRPFIKSTTAPGLQVTTYSAVQDVSPPRAVQDVPPPKAVQDVPPPKAVQDVPPPRAVQDVPPPKAVQDVPPPKAVQDVPPPKAVQDVPPPRAVQDVPPPKAVQDVPPPKAVQDVPPPKAVQDVPPPRAVQDVPPPKAVQDVLPPKAVMATTNVVSTKRVAPARPPSFRNTRPQPQPEPPGEGRAWGGAEVGLGRRSGGAINLIFISDDRR